MAAALRDVDPPSGHGPQIHRTGGFRPPEFGQIPEQLAGMGSRFGGRGREALGLGWERHKQTFCRDSGHLDLARSGQERTFWESVHMPRRGNPETMKKRAHPVTFQDARRFSEQKGPLLAIGEFAGHLRRSHEDNGFAAASRQRSSADLGITREARKRPGRWLVGKVTPNGTQNPRGSSIRNLLFTNCLRRKRPVGRGSKKAAP